MFANLLLGESENALSFQTSHRSAVFPIQFDLFREGQMVVKTLSQKTPRGVLHSVAQWNARWPIGTAVRYRPFAFNDEASQLTHTLTRAFVAADDAVIQIAGQNGYVPLHQCQPLGGSPAA